MDSQMGLPAHRVRKTHSRRKGEYVWHMTVRDRFNPLVYTLYWGAFLGMVLSLLGHKAAATALPTITKMMTDVIPSRGICISSLRAEMSRYAIRDVRVPGNITETPGP